MKETKNLLKGIGLTTSEIKVYLSLLEIGTSTKGPIVKKSGVASSKIYELLDKLTKKGLVSTITKTKVKHFEAANPKRILEYMKEKENKIKKQQEKLKEIIPLLEAKKAKEEGSETRVFKGIKGAKTAFEDIIETLKPGEELKVLGLSEIPEKFQEFLINFHVKRANKKIETRLLLGNKLQKMANQIKKQKLTKIKFHPPQTEFPTGLLIYKDKVLFSLAWDDIWIQIKNKRLAKSFKERFEEHWNQNTIIYKGIEGVRTALFSSLDRLKKGDEWLVIGAPKRGKELDNLLLELLNEKTKRGIMNKVLFNEKAQFDKRAQYEKIGLMQRKLMSEETPASTSIINDRVMILPKESKEGPMAIIIDNKEIAESFRIQFYKFWNQETIIIRGMKEVQKEMMENFEGLKPGESYDIVGAAFGGKGSKIEKSLKEFFKKYHAKRIKKGIHQRIIFEKGHEKWIKQNKWYYHTNGEVRFLPYALKSPVSTFTIGNKTKMMIQKEKPEIIIIDNKEITENHKQQFETLWKIAKE